MAAPLTQETSTIPQETSPGGLFDGYTVGPAFDEMFDENLRPRSHYQRLHHLLQQITPKEFRLRKGMTDVSMRQDGVGFTVYRHEEGIERVWPMDPMPRVIPSDE